MASEGVSFFQTSFFQQPHQAARDMDSDDFAQIAARYYEPLYKFALSLTRAEADACDLVQQTFYVWAAKGYQLRDHSKVKSWLFTTLHRAFLAARHRHTRFPHHGLEEVPMEDLPAYSPDFANAADSSQVRSALAKVDVVYQAAVALFYLEDCSYHDIAEILEVPLGTVKSRIARGIVQLRQLLGVAAPERSSRTVARPVNGKRAECDRLADCVGSPGSTEEDDQNCGHQECCADEAPSEDAGAEMTLGVGEPMADHPDREHAPESPRTVEHVCDGGLAVERDEGNKHEGLKS